MKRTITCFLFSVEKLKLLDYYNRSTQTSKSRVPQQLPSKLLDSRKCAHQISEYTTNFENSSSKIKKGDINNSSELHG